MHQEIIEGIDNLPQIIDNLDCKNIFLVVGSSFSLLNIKEYVDNLNVNITIFSDFTPNPLFEQICLGVDLFKESRCDAILAIGGGSAIDVAKCIKLAFISQEGKNALISPVVSKMIKCDRAKLPIIAIPTTAGSGSESTHNAVMYYKGVKQTVTNDEILPDYAILEASVLKTLPLYQKKCTIMDALCQSIESWWSVKATEESKQYSKYAIELIIQNWQKYIFGNEENAAKKIMVGANFAGKAINIAQTTAAHAMSYKITALYGLPHGHAVAICLPEIWQYMLNNQDNCVHPDGCSILSDIFNQIALSMNATSPTEAILKLRQIISDLELTNPTSDKKEEDLEILSHSVNPVRLKNNPIQLEFLQIVELYSDIIKLNEINK